MPANAQLTFQRTFGEANVDCAYSVQKIGDDGFIIAGYTTSFGAGSRDVYLIRTGLASGIYFYLFSAGDFVPVRKII